MVMIMITFKSYWPYLCLSHASIYTDIFYFDESYLAKKNCSSERALNVEIMSKLFLMFENINKSN